MAPVCDPRRPLAGLYALTPDDALTPRLLALVEAALAGGCRLVQYRNKTAPPALAREQAKALLPLVHDYGGCLIINDDVWLALEVGADGVHLGREDMPAGGLKTAREALGGKRILGVSCYDELARAEAAVAAGADYIAIGSVFASQSKPQATRASLSLVEEAKRRFSVPVCAIGGITVENAPAVLAAGADMLAVMSGLFDAMDIRRRAEEFLALFSAVPREPTLQEKSR